MVRLNNSSQPPDHFHLVARIRVLIAHGEILVRIIIIFKVNPAGINSFLFSLGMQRREMMFMGTGGGGRPLQTC
jgi:hypothetical protein